MPDFEAIADEWLTWARAPGHDAYWWTRAPFLELLGPPDAEDPRVLEVGCGEGRVARDLHDAGFAVTALDASPTLLAAAREADPASTYLEGRGEALPFADASFPRLVCFMVLMDVEDMPAVVAELGRVLAPGGVAGVAVLHPLHDAGVADHDDGGGWTGEDDDAAFVLRDYLTPRDYEVPIVRDGLPMTFGGRRHPLEDYVEAFAAAGLLIERLREPAAPAGVRGAARWARVPNFLHLRLVKGSA